MVTESYTPNDPAAQGAMPGIPSQRYSLAEIEAVSRKAARGAGLSWGLAEEAGKAARWLSGFGFQGVEALAALLKQNDGRGYDVVRPMSVSGVWWADDDALCPVAAGAALSDRSKLIAAGQEIECSVTSYPLLMVFFAGLCAFRHNTPIRIGWGGVSLICTRHAVLVEGDAGDLALACTSRVKCGIGTAPAPNDSRMRYFEPTSRLVCPDSWKQLEAYAFRVYAPATEQSRLAGAGAGTVDLD